MNIKLKMEDNPDLRLRVDEHGIIHGRGGINDYKQLKNLPTLNGELFVGAMAESDPTVQKLSAMDIIAICV